MYVLYQAVGEKLELYLKQLYGFGLFFSAKQNFEYEE